MPISAIKSILKISGAVLVMDPGRVVGIITPEELEDNAIPGIGTCAGLFTANTMAPMALRRP